MIDGKVLAMVTYRHPMRSHSESALCIKSTTEAPGQDNWWRVCMTGYRVPPEAVNYEQQLLVINPSDEKHMEAVANRTQSPVASLVPESIVNDLIKELTKPPLPPEPGFNARVILRNGSQYARSHKGGWIAMGASSPVYTWERLVGRGIERISELHA